MILSHIHVHMSKGLGKLLTKKKIKIHQQDKNQGMFLRAYLG
jgi:hypothetical protein